jgi:hypothetical protein
MASNDNDRHQNGFGGRNGQKRSRKNDSDEEEESKSKASSSKKSRRVIDDGEDEEVEFDIDIDSDPSDSLEQKTPKTKIETIARKKVDGGKEDVTPRSSSPSRLISNILKRVDPLKKRSSPSDVRSSRPTQDPSKAPQDGATKVPKKSKAQVPSQDAPKSLLANISKRSPIDDPKVNPRPVSRPQSRPQSRPPPRPQTKPEQPKVTTNSETTKRSLPNARPQNAPPDGSNANNLASSSANAPPVQPDNSTPAARLKPIRSRAYKLIEAAVVNNLQELCATTKLTLPPNNTRQRIDLAGSFFPDDETQHFFDTNDAGEIVLHPRKPIFPEEFPAGMKEQDLSWWGIVDQKKDEKKKPFPDAT